AIVACGFAGFASSPMIEVPVKTPTLITCSYRCQILSVKRRVHRTCAGRMPTQTGLRPMPQRGNPIAYIRGSETGASDGNNFGEGAGPRAFRRPNGEGSSAAKTGDHRAIGLRGGPRFRESGDPHHRL